jgi:hypothetical protein
VHQTPHGVAGARLLVHLVSLEVLQRQVAARHHAVVEVVAAEADQGAEGEQGQQQARQGHAGGEHRRQLAVP